MTTKKIIEQMENIVLDLIVDCDLHIGEARRPKIRKMLHTLLNSFAEEIIGGYTECPNCDNNEQLEYVKSRYEIDNFQNQQRLKVKEILESL